jgi:hypothetical protein
MKASGEVQEVGGTNGEQATRNITGIRNTFFIV